MHRRFTHGFLLITLLFTLGLQGYSQTDVEFWFVAPEITEGHGNFPGGEPVYFRVSALELDAEVRIYQPANNAGMDTTFTVPAKSTISIDASPWINDLENKPGDLVLNKGVHIVSSNLITVYYDEDEYWNQDIFALKGKNALGLEFYTPFNHTWGNGTNYRPRAYSSIDIVATENNTIVTITPTADVVGHGAGSTYSVTLQKGETYSCLAVSQAAAGHLGGSHVTSNKPIAVTLKDDSVHGTPQGCKDLIGDQTVPIINADGKRIVGYEYIVMRGKINLIDPNAINPDPDGVTTGERIFVMAVEPNTQVFIDGVLLTTLTNPGDQIDYQISKNSTHVEGDKPIMVLHVAGFGCEFGGAVLPTVDGCTGSVEVSFTRSTTRNFYLNIMTIDAAKHAFTMHYEDGSSFPIPDTWFEQVGSTDYVCLKKDNKLFPLNGPGNVPQSEVVKITNTVSVFHLGLIEGGTTTGCKYGYFSDYSEAEGEVRIVESGSRSAFRCFGDTLQLTANGGISYTWSPSQYLDDPFVATPIATPPPGVYNYDVTIHRGCLGDTVITAIVGIADEVEAFFESDKWYFCAPDTVTFDNQSFGVDMSSVINMQWDFDLEDPFNAPVYDLSPVMEHAYTNTTDTVESKTVQLIVWNAQGCSHEFKRDLIIRPEISADFSTDIDNGCHPVTVNFNNLSTGNTDRYKWDLGDGSSSNTANVNHTYFNHSLADSTYHVEMVAISPFFCSDTAEADIDVYPYIEAAFAIDTFQGCSPLVISIDNNSAGYIDVFEWNFGDGSPDSPLPDPTLSHTYTNTTDDPINYTLRLVVRNMTRGCTDTISRLITVFPEVSSNFIPDVLSACHDSEIGFINMSSATANTFAWDFGDGGSSSLRHPDHVFENMNDVNANYTVRLISTTPNMCRDTSYQSIEIYPYIKAEYAVNEVQGCAPFLLTLQNASLGSITEYEWYWGDDPSPGTSADSIQTHLYVNTGTAPLTRTLQLLVKNAEGCTDSMSREITVFPEVSSQFTPDVTGGCNELSVGFNNQSSATATSFLWEFGDGTSSNEAAPVHVFQNTGYADSVYTTKLIASSAGGCADTSELDITVFPFLAADFTFNHATVCTPFDLTLNNVSLGGENYHWDFGDGDTLNVSDTSPIVHRFSNPSPTDPTIYEIVLTVTNSRGCSSVKRKEITVLSSVQALATPTIVEGCHPVTVEFDNTSIGAISYTWDFDNGWSSDEDSPTMTFENFGTSDTVYNVRLIANNLYTCKDSVFIPVTVHPNTEADFAIEYLDQCSPAQVVFTNSSVNGDEFSWTFDTDPLLTNSSAPIQREFTNISFSNTAIFPVNLSVLSPQGCTSSVTKEVSVHHSVEAVIPDKSPGCHPLETNFTSFSRGARDYKWDFGDNTSSILENPVHVFSNDGRADTVYTVKLMAISENFCRDSAFSDITVYPGAKAKFDVDATNGCSPLDISIQNMSESGANFVWTFGDGSAPQVLTDMSSQSHSYTNQAEEVVYRELRLDVATDNGCSDFITQTIAVYPSVDVDFERDSAGCSPYFSTFTNTSQRSTNYIWSFNDGDYSYVSEPGHTFVNTDTINRVFHVELWGASQYGCADSMIKTVTVYPSPVARFSYDPIYQYFPNSTVTLNNETNTGNYTYEWDFDDSSSSAERDPGSHTYDHWGEYNIRLKASNVLCTDSVEHWLRIFPPMPIAEFTVDRDSGCVPLNITLTNHSMYGDEYFWEFGDGSTSEEFEPTHTFYEAGFYQIKLTVRGEGGEDYAFHEFEVFPLPQVDFFLEPTLVMLPDEFIKTFNLTKHGSRYQWDFGDGISTYAEDTSHVYAAPGVYDVSLHAWTIHGCEAYKLIPEAVEVIGEGKVLFPNVFRPFDTGPTDGWYNPSEHLNRIFYPVHEGVVEYKLEIYNRWGERLFHTTEINRGWDGYYQDVLCAQGVYVWQVWVVYANGKTENLAGDVTLLYKTD